MGFKIKFKEAVFVRDEFLDFQEKTVAPKREVQEVVADTGFDGLKKVTVKEIPSNLQDVSATTAKKETVLQGEKFISANGEVIEGSMPNNGAVLEIIDTQKTFYNIPKGYHNGNGAVSLSVERQTIVPTKTTQIVNPSNGKVLSEVNIQPIPEEYIIPEGLVSIVENGTYEVTEYAKVNVDVPNPVVEASGERKELSGTYDGSTVEVTENGELDIGALLNEKKLPLKIYISVLPTVVVKFYNGDELLETQTLKAGDKIIPPASPTKESTAQYSYSFKGWSLDRETVAEVGTAGTSDLTYYALFEATLRYYTVRFLNSDGTVLQTTSVAYGETPVYAGGTPVDPNNEGDFNGWVPDIVAVTGEADYTATYFTPPALAYTLNSDNASYSVSGIGPVTDTDIVIPSYYKGLPVTIIGTGAFSGETGVTSITIPDNITEMKTNAFYNCINLKRVYITDIAAWCGILFAQGGNPLRYAQNLYVNNSLITELVIPDGVTSIGQYAFNNCSNLTSITIPDSITEIGGEAFYNCINLKRVYITDIAAWCGILQNKAGANPLSLGADLYLNGQLVTDLKLPDGITSIGGASFRYCQSLTSVEIPESVSNIGNFSLRDCPNLTTIRLLSPVPPTLGIGVIADTATVTIIVPKGSGDTYKSATNWSNYADKIVEATE